MTQPWRIGATFVGLQALLGDVFLIPVASACAAVPSRPWCSVAFVLHVLLLRTAAVAVVVATVVGVVATALPAIAAVVVAAAFAATALPTDLHAYSLQM